MGERYFARASSSAPRRRYDEDFDDREEDDFAWWGFAKEEDCNTYVDSFGIIQAMVAMTCIGCATERKQRLLGPTRVEKQFISSRYGRDTSLRCIPKLITGVGLTWTLMKETPPAPGPVEPEAAAVQMVPMTVPAQEVKIVQVPQHA